MKSCFSFLIILILTSCNVRYKVLNSGQGVRSNMSINNLVVTKIDSVLSFDEWGVPDDFISGERYSVKFTDSSDYPKKLLFFRKSDNYCWYSTEIDCNILPINFSESGWYIVSGLKSFDKAARSIVYFVDKNKKVKQYYRSAYLEVKSR